VQAQLHQKLFMVRVALGERLRRIKLLQLRGHFPVVHHICREDRFDQRFSESTLLLLVHVRRDACRGIDCRLPSRGGVVVFENRFSVVSHGPRGHRVFLETVVVAGVINVVPDRGHEEGELVEAIKKFLHAHMQCNAIIQHNAQ